jgi:RNA polymerase sigma-70 factor (ECF subfamily)
LFRSRIAEPSSIPKRCRIDEFLQAGLAAPEPVAAELQDEQILAALGKIPPDYKAVVLLVDVEEFSYKEASGILGIPIGTVMSRLSRGRKLLREQLTAVAVSYGIVKDIGTEQGR